MRGKAAVIFLFCFLGVYLSLNANEPVGVIKFRNPAEFLKKTNIFLSKENVRSANLASLELVKNTEYFTALDFSKPFTAYLYFASPAVQTVFFGSVRTGVKLENVPLLPGLTLVPEIKNGKVIYADPKFRKQIKNLNENTIPLPQKMIAGKYFFRKPVKLPGQTDSDNEFAAFLSGELKQISFSADFLADDLLKAEAELEATEKSGLNQFTNSQRPVFRSYPRILPKPEFYIFTALPPNQTAARGITAFLSLAVSSFFNDEHIYGCFLHSVMTGDHATAMMLSKNQEYYLLSGIFPTAERKAHFENFLKTHGDSYSGKAFIFHNDDGTDIYATVIGNTANLLIKKKDGVTQEVLHAFRSAHTFRPVITGREFLVGMYRMPDGKYEKMISGTIFNGKIRMDMTLRPNAVLRILPQLFTGEDLFQE